MAIWSNLLRVVLSIALVLNGIGGAVAATRMHADQISAAEHTSSPKPANTAMPCHQHQLSQAADGHTSAQSAPAAPEKSQLPDCCESGICACACAHATQVVLLAPPGTVPILNRNLTVKPLPLAHAAPALPHLIRPPIG